MYERERERERETDRQTDRQTEREAERERERERQTDRQTDRQTETERDRDRDRARDRDSETETDRKTGRPGVVVKEKKARTSWWFARIKLPNTWSLDVQWVFFVFERHPHCEQPFRRKLINRRQELKKKIKKKNSRRSAESFHEVWQPSQESEEPKTISDWGLSGEELSKLKFQAKAKLSVGFESEKTELKIIEKTKICIPVMLKPYSASSFCLPNKNRVGVAHGDGTNLEVVYSIPHNSCRQRTCQHSSLQTVCRQFHFGDSLLVTDGLDELVPLLSGIFTARLPLSGFLFAVSFLSLGHGQWRPGLGNPIFMHAPSKVYSSCT